MQTETNAPFNHSGILNELSYKNKYSKDSLQGGEYWFDFFRLTFPRFAYILNKKD